MKKISTEERMHLKKICVVLNKNLIYEPYYIIYFVNNL